MSVLSGLNVWFGCRTKQVQKFVLQIIKRMIDKDQKNSKKRKNVESFEEKYFSDTFFLAFYCKTGIKVLKIKDNQLGR